MADKKKDMSFLEALKEGFKTQQERTGVVKKRKRKRLGFVGSKKSDYKGKDS